MSKKIEEQLVLHRIPFVVVDGTLFWKRKEIQDVMAYLRLAVGLQDDTALLRIINTPKRKIGAASVDRLVAYARAAGVTLSALLFGAPAEQRGEGMAVELPPLPSRGELGIKPKAEQALQGFRELVANLHAVARTAPLPHLLAEIVEQTSFREHLLLPGKKEAGGGRMNGKEALERLEQLIASAKEFWPGTLSGGGPQEVLGDEEEGAPDAAALSPLQHAQAFLLESALHSAGDDAQQAQRVRLMTMHAAKGLEFEVVFVVGCEDAQLPGLRGDDDCGELYAARRLFYVALTRAKSRLLLSHALQDPGGWGGQFMEPSRSGRGGASRALNTAIHGWSIQYQTAVLRWC